MGFIFGLKFARLFQFAINLIDSQKMFMQVVN